MRKDITTNILVDGGEKINKSALARQYGCCWRTIDRRFNPEKYKHEKKEDLIQYFTYVENRSSVQFVVSDMYEPYLLVTQIMFPKAKYVVDRFHYIRYIMDALDKIRIRLQKEYGYNL